MGFGDLGMARWCYTSIQIFWKFGSCILGCPPYNNPGGDWNPGQPPVVAHVFWIGGIWKYTINVHSNWIYIRWKGFNVYAGQLESTEVVPSAILQCLWFQRNLPKNTKKRYISNKSANKVENSTVLFEYEPWRSVYTIKKQVTQNWNHLRFKKKSTLVKMNIYHEKILAWTCHYIPSLTTEKKTETGQELHKRDLHQIQSPIEVAASSCFGETKKFTQNKKVFFSPPKKLGKFGKFPYGRKNFHVCFGEDFHFCFGR